MGLIGFCRNNTVKSFLIINPETIDIDIVFAYWQADLDLIVHIRIKNPLDYSGAPKVVTVKYEKNRINFRELVRRILKGNGNCAGILSGQTVTPITMTGSHQRCSQYGFSQEHLIQDLMGLAPKNALSSACKVIQGF